MIKKDLNEDFLLLLGIFSTIQLLSLFGITVFNIFLILTAVILLPYNIKRLDVDKYFLVSVSCCFITLLLSMNNTLLSNGFKKAAFVGGVIYLLVLFVYLLMNSVPNYAKKLINGFNISCKLTLLWCYLQIGFYYMLRVDLNTLVFGKMLRIPNATGAYLNEELIPSGFYSHRAILLPSLFYLFFSTSNVYLMASIVLVGCFTKSTALIMGLALALGFKTIIYIKKNRLFRVSKRKILSVFFLIFIVAAGALVYSSKIVDLVKYVGVRILDTTSNKADNSSVVHFLYYKNLGAIIQNMNLGNFLFGTGFNTSGQHYTWFNGQYSNMESWVVESDYINILLNQGLVGIILWIYILIKLVIISKKYRYWENIALVLTVAFVGIMYNIQFTWFLVIEMGILILAKNKVQAINPSKKKGHI